MSSLAVGGISLLSTASAKSSNTANKGESAAPKIVENEQGERLNVIGDNQLIKLTGADTGNQFTLVEQDNAPGIGIPPHVHQNEDEVFKVNSGEVEVTVGSDSAVLKEGDLVFCPRGIPHSWKVIGTENAKVSMSIFPSGLENMFAELAQLPKGKPDMAKVTEICGRYKISFV